MCSCVRVFSKGLGTRSFFWGRGWVGGCLFFLSHTWSARTLHVLHLMPQLHATCTHCRLQCNVRRVLYLCLTQRGG